MHDRAHEIQVRNPHRLKDLPVLGDEVKRAPVVISDPLPLEIYNKGKPRRQ